MTTFFKALQANPIIIDSDVVAAARLLFMTRAQEANIIYKTVEEIFVASGPSESLEEKISEYMTNFRNNGKEVFRPVVENLFRHTRRGRMFISKTLVNFDSLPDNNSIPVRIYEYIPELIAEIGYFSDGSPEFYVRFTYLTDNTSTEKIVNQIKQDIQDMGTKEPSVYITKASMNGSEVAFTEVKLDQTKLGKDCFYPYLPVPMDEYIDAYLESDARVLIIFGEPGTGKSTLVRTILSKLGKKAISCNCSKSLASGAVLTKVTSNGFKALAMEDVDTLLRPRSEGNEFMSSLLDQGDGLAASDVKIIISTNLSSVEDIDTALTREGRTFDIIEAVKLTHKEALTVADEMSISTAEMEERPYTLSSVFSLNRPTFTLFSKRGRKRNPIGFGFNAN